MADLQKKLQEVSSGNSTFLLEHEKLTQERIDKERAQMNKTIDRIEQNFQHNAIPPNQFLNTVGSWIFGAQVLFCFNSCNRVLTFGLVLELVSDAHPAWHHDDRR